MPGANHPSRVGRRGFVRAAAVVAGAAATPTVVERAAAQSTLLAEPARTAGIHVAATIVRADFSADAPGRLNVGVRASLRAPGTAVDGLVLVVEGVDFSAAPAELSRSVTEDVRAQIARFLGERGSTVDPEGIAVRLFGAAI